MPKSTSNALLIFIKNPQKGHVKTRLAATVGDERALEIYKKLLVYTRQTVKPLQADKQVWYSQFIPRQDEWDDVMFAKKKQQGETLGTRMQRAFKQVFNKGYQRVVIIGSDCGQLKGKHLEHAYEALETNDVVIGPAEDGGYYLLGMRKFFPVLFKDKPWSTDDVFGQTVNDCKTYGLSYHVLEMLNDVDTKEDWNQIKGQF
ncbi:MAG: TIGR04282 family arsenosugar biosynthesis glycosyltransferase [Balneolaceae bacterium]|nr:TIGR04282 family arsenosugar biosynthesis glycosyltransferase [Balneolaceae bacterium]